MAQISNSSFSANTESQSTLLPGAMIGGRFEVVQMIRRDFVGTVYHARDGRSQRDVECLLINLPAEDNYRLLDLRAHIHEAKQIRLKSFASTYGIGKQGSDGYVVRQSIEGRPLTDHLNHRSQNHRPFKQRGLCSLLIEVIQALEALRSQETDVNEHGLIRPSVMMIQNQQKPRVRLTDIGIGLIRDTLVKHTEYDAWTRGCIPELRGEAPPLDADLYAIGALLFQMTQLRPFTQGWLRELSTSPTFSQLPDLIEACTASHPMITLTDLKSELKYAAQSQVEIGGLTKDLSHLQERLQKIIDYESEDGSEPEEGSSPTDNVDESGSTEPRSSQELISSEESVSVIFHQLPEQTDGLSASEHVPLHLTPPPEELFITGGEDREQVSPRSNLISAPAAIQDSVSDYPIVIETEDAHIDQVSSLAQEGESLLLDSQSPATPLTRESSDEVEVDMSALNSMMNNMFHDDEERVLEGEANEFEPLTPHHDAEERNGPHQREYDMPESANTHHETATNDEVIEVPTSEAIERAETLHGADIEEIESELYSSAMNVDLSAYQSSTPAQPPTLNLPPQDRSEFEPPAPGLMDLPLPSLPSPAPASFPDESDLDGRRWIVMRDGKDYGPYTLDELSKQLFREEINLDTEIWDIETDQRALLGEFSSLDHVLNEWAKERVVRRQQREERAKKAKARRRLFLMFAIASLGAIIFAGVNYGPEIKAAMLPAPASVKLDTWIAPPPQMNTLTRLKENPEKRAERLRLRKQQQIREDTLRTSREMSREARMASSATQVDFDKRGGAKLAPFSRTDFNRVLGGRQARLLSCIEAESQRTPSRSIFKVTLTVQQSGNFINAQLLNGTSKGKTCVFKAIRKLKMKPFSGGDKTITLPYQLK